MLTTGSFSYLRSSKGTRMHLHPHPDSEICTTVTWGIKINPSCLKNIQSKILPWMESPAGAIRCYDTDRSTTPRDISTNPTPSTPENENWVVPILPDYSNESDGSDIKLCMKGIVQEKCSFRFQDFAL
ncbi:Hypothetical predicted protein [Olea europaea subsp. europaea]|uniref:Uncharacterized protein n=1 Tax=Olea europaea subsp. europaea TaxID=158383 RepID=A0A8S0Q515_OLEEU|nr:Hypothetical predicted protein [Olea europaea subsp. europaea]